MRPEAQLNLAYHSLSQAAEQVFWVSMHGRLLYANDSASRVLGYSNAELLNMHMWDIAPSFSGNMCNNHWIELKNKSGMVFEGKQTAKSGRVIDVEVSSRYLISDGIEFSCAIVRDITQRKKKEQELIDAKEQLQKSERMLRTFVENSLDVIFVLDKRGNFRFVSPSWEKHFGYHPSEVIGRSFTPVVHSDDIRPCLNYLNQIMTTGIPATSPTYRVKCADGSWKVFVANGSRFTDSNGEPLFHGIGRDIAGQEAYINSLNYMSTCFNEALNSSRHILYRLDVKNGYDYLSPVFEEITGHPLQEYKRVTLEKLASYFHPDDIPRIRAQIDGLFQERTGPTVKMELEYRFKKADGSYCWFIDSTTACFNEQGELSHYVGSAYDITERKTTEEKLRQSESTLSAIFYTSPDAININQLDTAAFVEINDKFTELTGYTANDVIGKPSTELNIWIIPEDRTRLANLLRIHGSVDNFESKIRRKDGIVLTILVSSTLIEIAGKICTLNFVRDITEREAFLYEATKIQKLESLGLLAGGIAHDFNNLLSGVLGNVSLARKYIPAENRAAELLEKSEKAAIQATALTKQLLTFSKGGEPVKSVVDPLKIINDSIALSIQSTNVKSEIICDHNIWAIHADPGQMNQVVNNLCHYCPVNN